MKLVLATLPIAACAAQVDAGYAGQPLARLSGTAAGFGPADVVDAARVRWNPQRGADLTAGPREALPIESAPPSSLTVLVLAEPPDGAYFGFDGEPARIAEGALFLTHGDDVIGEVIDDLLVYVDGEVAPGSLAAAYLGDALAPGFHLRDQRATAELTPAQAVLAARCGGGEACRVPRLYRLVATPADLDTEVVFFRTITP
ncbi:MAG: hypothetical protein ABIY55_03450 [Kofleriaceae bacterium]